ncbi:hypothetical protein [Gluconobacter wancherniae]|uniref:Uncharacterized protein n=1 Tax=Gluconobacter wancherniae NBRC 103581 TaxID=656744 RepID=A0A511AYB7_9PROT|nr:hypothetical protein [Gluconobacter wancherniae]MBF0853368.1 hypothetical protein [Gluconobacter wancherniae]GBR65930.1 hypothetical protein AA103581_2081 [Gluconobacter wancherniae NBRC 103581]GEK93198.1 hypothetical protein GWA01_09680 [Gluconobacter wancherniae NBRC 103581]
MRRDPAPDPNLGQSRTTLSVRVVPRWNQRAWLEVAPVTDLPTICEALCLVILLIIVSGTEPGSV